MNHLSPEHLIDLAEGAAAESSAPHLQTCAECRRQLETLRGAMSEAAAVGVPEPSPLFWDRLSARVKPWRHSLLRRDGGARTAP